MVRSASSRTSAISLMGAVQTKTLRPFLIQSSVSDRRKPNSGYWWCQEARSAISHSSSLLFECASIEQCAGWSSPSTTRLRSVSVKSDDSERISGPEPKARSWCGSTRYGHTCGEAMLYSYLVTESVRCACWRPRICDEWHVRIGVLAHRRFVTSSGVAI